MTAQTPRPAGGFPNAPCPVRSPPRHDPGLQRDRYTNLFRLGEHALNAALNGGRVQAGWLALPQGHLLIDAAVLRDGSLHHLRLTRPPGGELQVSDAPLTHLLDEPHFQLDAQPPEPYSYVWAGSGFTLRPEARHTPR